MGPAWLMLSGLRRSVLRLRLRRRDRGASPTRRSSLPPSTPSKSPALTASKSSSSTSIRRRAARWSRTATSAAVRGRFVWRAARTACPSSRAIARN